MATRQTASTRQLVNRRQVTRSPLTFGLNVGLASTDVISFPTISTFPNENVSRTISLWTYVRSTGGGTLGRVFVRRNTFLACSNNNVFNYSADFTTTPGVFTFKTTGFNQWVHIVITHDLTSVANIPTIYVNNVPVTVTVATAPVGTATTNTTFFMGNVSGSPIRNYDGFIKDFKMYDRVLSSDEVSQLYQGYTPTTNLQINLPINETSGASTITDTVTGKVGALSGCAISPINLNLRPILRDFGTSLFFNGSTSKVTVTDNANLRPGNGDFTISTWLRFPMGGNAIGQTGGLILGKGFAATAPANTWGLIRSSIAGSRVIYEDVNDTGGVFANVLNGPVGWPSSGWHYIVVTRQGTNYTMYFDGQFASYLAGVASNLSTTANLQIGADASGTTRLLQGGVDETKFWTRAITADEVMREYLYGGVTGSNLQLYFDYNEVSGSTATDKSGNGNSGAITAGAYSSDVAMKPRQSV